MKQSILLAVLGAVLLVAARGAQAQKLHTDLRGFQEVPANSTVAGGEFKGEIISDTTIAYELTFSGLEGSVLQAHIHFGQKSVAGGISLWLCGTATNPGPAGTPTCPASGTVSRTLIAADVVGPAGQGIAGGELAEIIKAIRAGVSYANVHSTKFPAGEIRGQIKVKGRHED